MKAKIISFLLFFYFTLSVIAQNISVTNVKGYGKGSYDATTDALRNAIAQGAGIALQGNSEVSESKLIVDIIKTQTSGYIVSHKVLKEGNYNGMYEVVIDAEISREALKQSIESLGQLIGEVRFLVMYDPENVNADNKKTYDYAVSRLNESIKAAGFRYIEFKAFEKLKEETANLFLEDNGDMSFAQKLALYADAQYLIEIKDLQIRQEPGVMDAQKVKVSMEVTAFDRNSAEGLGTTPFEGEWAMSSEVSEAAKVSVTNAISGSNGGFGRLMNYVYEKSLGPWVNTGAPYELRFYGLGGSRNLIPLTNKLKASPGFKGSMNMQQASNFSKLTFLSTRLCDEMWQDIITFSDQVPELKPLSVDIKLQLGRQLSFAPANIVLPAQKTKDALSGAVENVLGKK
jgi:hypothetical protein